MSKMGSVPFKHGLIIKSRENASLQNDLRADSKWNGSSEKRKVTSLEGRKEKFRRVFQKAVEFGLGFKRCVEELWVGMMIAGEKAVLHKEPEFSSGEAEELSRDVLLNLLLFQGSNYKKRYTTMEYLFQYLIQECGPS